ncbi:unnamed protein product [Malus baccata var. baccata]
MYLQKFNAPVTYILLPFFFFSFFRLFMIVLAINNAAMSFLAGESMDVINKVMRIHVFLEFYTLNKFKSMPTSQTTQVTTLFESPNQQRYLNITKGGTVSIVFAARSEKVKVASVVQVSKLILPSSFSSSPFPLAPPTSISSPSPSSSSPSQLTPSSSSPSPTSTPFPSPSSSSSSPSTPSSSPPSSSRFKITQILNKYPKFSIFNDFLTRTQICNQINERRTLTILVPNNEAMYSLVGQPMDMIKKKFHNLLVSQFTRIITLLKPSDKPSGQQGFVNVTNGDMISIVSAAVSSSSPSLPPSSPTSSTLNITKTLNDYPDFGQLNSYLIDTQVCDQINVRTTITIFVVNNASMSYLVRKSNEVKKMVLSLHVVMDYYTLDKFKSFPNSIPLIITDQPSGLQGLVNITNEDKIPIVSTAGSNQVVVVRDVANDEPSYISVVQISNIILPSSFMAPTSSPSLTLGKARYAAPVQASSNSPTLEIPKEGKASTSSNATAPEAPKQGEASPSNSSAPKAPKLGNVSPLNRTKHEEPKQDGAPPANGIAHEAPSSSNGTSSEAPQQGKAPTSPNAPTSDVLTSLNVAPSSGCTTHGTTIDAPAPNSSRRFFATYKSPKAIRGGIPICFPQSILFQRFEGHSHAFVNKSVIPSMRGANLRVMTHCQMIKDVPTRQLWCLRYEFRLRVTLGPGGDLMLTSRIRNTNTDGKSFTFTFAYHTYLAVTDIRFKDTIFCRCNSCRISNGESFDQSMFFGTKLLFVWNPWDKKAKAITDFGDDEYKNMLCVQAACVEKPVEEWKGRQELSAVPSSYCRGQLDPRKVLLGG